MGTRSKDARSILSRKSIRAYTGDKLTEGQKEEIFKYISDEKNLVGLKGNRMKVEFREVSGTFSGRIGTYGMIRKAPSFLICICRNDRDSILDCGYVFEKLILFLESLDMGTCWMGGTFDREKLAGDLELGDHEFIPVITPVGNKRDNLSMRERLVRRSVKADKRLDFDKLFFKNDFRKRIEDEMTREILELVRLAPSASNKQPWRVVIGDDGTAHFYIERTPGYGGQKVGYDIQWLDIGIAMAHYLIARGRGDLVVEDPGIEMLSQYSEYVGSIRDK